MWNKDPQHNSVNNSLAFCGNSFDGQSHRLSAVGLTPCPIMNAIMIESSHSSVNVASVNIALFSTLANRSHGKSRLLLTILLSLLLPLSFTSSTMFWRCLGILNAYGGVKERWNMGKFEQIGGEDNT
jgi:hypothetical protein